MNRILIGSFLAGFCLPALAGVVFEVDLTKGSAAPGAVSGGTWDKGWKTTGAKDERIVFDAGGPVANGILEASFTVDELPWKHGTGKINYIGLHEEASLSQNKHRGDLFYARTGNANYRFSNVKAAGRPFDRTEHEPRVGSAEDWIADGKTVHTIKLEWRDGVPMFHDPKGRVTVFPRDVIGGDTPVDRLRYVFLGSDRFTGLTVPGLRFLRVKLTDLGSSVDSPPVEKLRVHEGGRWLTGEHGRPVFLLADTAWFLAMNLRKEEVTEYLRVRRSQRFNAITFVAMNPVMKTNAYGAAPFGLTQGRMNPAQPLTAEGYDYWDHVDFIVGQARKLGMYVILLPAWGNAMTGAHGGAVTEEIVLNRDNARAYGEWLGRRYAGESHIIWMLGGDRSAVYGDKDYRPVVRAMADGIAKGVGKSGMLTSYHPRKLHPQSSEWFHGDPWLSFNSIQHWPEDQIASIQSDWQKTPVKPTWIFEGRYEGYWKGGYKPGQWGEWQTRFQAYQTVLAGAFGHTYGHERIFGFGQEDWAGKKGWDWKNELQSPGARSMTHLARFLNSMGEKTLLSRIPDQSLIEGDQGKAERLSSDRIAAMRTADSRLAMFYSANGRSIRIRMDKFAAGPMFAWWFNPRNGKWHASGSETPEQHFFASGIASGPGSGVREFDPPGEPGEGTDWVLVLSASEGT